MIVAKITEQKANELKGTEFAPDNYFNPIQDVNGNWIISLQELEHCSIEFTNLVELIKFEPVITDIEL